MIKYTSCPTIPKIIAQAACDQGISPAAPRGAGQSLCAQLVTKSERYPAGVKFSQHPSRPLQDALSNFILALPRELRTMIYSHFLGEIRPRPMLPAVRSDAGRKGDVYMYQFGCWRKTFPQEDDDNNDYSHHSPAAAAAVSADTSSSDRKFWDPHMILEYDPMPAKWTNLRSFFHGMTPARHLRSLDNIIVAEVIQDLCLCTSGSSVRLVYVDGRPSKSDGELQDALLYQSLIRYSRDLTLTISLKPSGGSAAAPALHYVVDDILPLLQQSQRLAILRLWIVLCSPVMLCLDSRWLSEQLRPLTELTSRTGRVLDVQVRMCECCAKIVVPPSGAEGPLLAKSAQRAELLTATRSSPLRMKSYETMVTA